MQRKRAVSLSISLHYAPVHKMSDGDSGILSDAPTKIFHMMEATMKTMKNVTLSIAAILLLAACGSKTSDRALSGAGIGAGVGAVSGALMGSPVTGAVVGGAVGAAAGGLTKQEDINLGEPVWR
jgi:uncharacterized membrane protein